MGLRGYNPVKTTTNCTLSATSGDVTGQDPCRGRCKTMAVQQLQALLIGSPAIDAGNMANCQDETVPGECARAEREKVNRQDQREVSVRRTQAKLWGTILVCGFLWLGTICALQVSAAPAATTYYVDPAGNNGNACTAPGVSACKTIGGALGKAVSGDSIVVAAGTYNEHLTFSKSVTVTGAGANSTIVDGGKTDRVLTVTNGSFLVLSSLQVKNGNSPVGGGGILNDGALALNNVSVLTNSATFGGGIYNAGSLALVNSSVLSNAAGYGGGIYNYGPVLLLASTTLSESVIGANHAITDGGGIYSSHNISVLGGSALLKVQSTVVENNSAGRSGAGIFSNGTLTVTLSSIQNNRSNDVTGVGGGGGIYVEAGLAGVNNSSLDSDSTYSGFGGGLYNLSGTVAISSTYINSSGAANGGGLSTGPGGNTRASNSTFFGDTSFRGGAVENRGLLTLTNVILQESRADYAGGGIYNSGSLSASGGRVISNMAWGGAYGGGGIYLDGGSASVDGMDVNGNQANITYTVSGGGIYVAAGSVLTLSNSRVNDNRFGYLGDGGGIAAYSSTIKLYNVSLHNNLGQGAGYGGGLYLLSVTATLSALDIGGNSEVYAGGGIYGDLSQITLTNSDLSDNSASAYGGGIHTTRGTLNLTNVTLSSNSSGSDGGGIDLSDTPASLTNVTLSHNQSTRYGGGINHYQNTLTLNNVTLSRNVSDDGAGRGDGGAIHTDSGLLAGTNSTLDHNAAGARGGGIFNASHATSNLTNVTLSANSAITGGGLYNQAGIFNASIITLTNVTFKDNSAIDGGGVYNANDPLNFVFLKNALIADSPSGGNCKGKAFTASKYSLSSDGTCALAGAGNLNSMPAQLNLLANNGGPTNTHLPKPTSAAVDGVGGSDCPSTDQRGMPRPQGASCDIGAVERQPLDPALSPVLYLPTVIRP